MSQHSTVQIGKHTFVGGLTWVSLSKPREFKREAISTAIKFSGDCYVIHSGSGTTQVGIGVSADGAAPRQLSLAATIATLVAENGPTIVGRGQRLNDWIGVFAITEELFAFVAVRDGAIMPNGDFLGSFNEAVDQLEHSYGIGGWTAVLGTPDIGANNYHNFNPVDLNALLPVKNGRIAKADRFALLSVKSRLDAKRLALLGAVGIVALGSALTWWKQSRDAQIQADIAAKQAELAALIGQAPKRKSAEYPKRWQSRPAAAAVINVCLDQFKHLRPGGWFVDTYVCSEFQSETLFVRGTSRTSFIKDVLPMAVLDPSGEKAVLTVAHSLQAQDNSSLPTFEDLRTRAASIWQGMNVAYQITEGKMPEPPPMTTEEAANTDMMAPQWREHAFTVGPTVYGPNQMRASMGSEGVRLTRLIYKDQKWTYEGVIYAHQ